MDRIKRVSLFFRGVFQVLFIALPIILVVAWMSTPYAFTMLYGIVNISFIPHTYNEHMLHAFTNQERLLGFSVCLIPLLFELYILYSLIKLFNLYSKGVIFSADNVRCIKHIGFGLLFMQLLHPVYQGLMGVAITWHNPPGHRLAIIVLDQTNFGMMLVGLIIILISWIMAEGCQLREDQQLTI